MQHFTLFFTSFLCLYLTPSVAQDGEAIVTWGELISSTAANDEVRPMPVFLSPGGSYLVYAESGSRVSLQSYDADHQMTAEVTDKYEVEKENFLPSQFLATTAGTFGCTFVYDKKNDRSQLYAGKMTPKGVTGLRRKYTIRGQVKPKNMLASSGAYHRLELNKHLVTSPDSNLILYAEAMKEGRKEDQEYVELAVFDANFVRRWRRALTLDLLEKEFHVGQAILNDSATVYFTANSFVQESLVKTQAGRLYVYAADADTLLRQQVTLPDGLLPLNARIDVTGGAGQYLTMTGLYSNDKDGQSVSGSFLLRFDQQLNVMVTTVTPFDESVSTKRRWFESVNTGNDYAPNDFVEFADGSVWTFFEQRDLSLERTLGTGGTGPGSMGSTKEVLRTYEIAILRYDAAGEYIGTTIVPKINTIAPNLEDTYDAFVYAGQVYILLNEHREREAGLRVLATMGMSMQSTVVQIDAAGEIVQRKPLNFYNPYYGRRFYPSDCLRIDGTVLLTVHKQRGSCFAVLDLEDLEKAGK